MQGSGKRPVVAQRQPGAWRCIAARRQPSLQRSWEHGAAIRTVNLPPSEASLEPPTSPPAPSLDAADDIAAAHVSLAHNVRPQGDIQYSDISQIDNLCEVSVRNNW